MALQYVTRAYFTDDCIYTAGFQVSSTAELDRVLERAERDVDDFVGPWSMDSTTGRKLTNAGLDANRLGLVKDAVCVQALWRIQVGEDEFINSQYDSVSGPDFSTQGKRSRTSPQAKRLLTQARVVRRGARVVA